MAIRVVGDILKQFSEEPPVSMQKTFCGHIGGDDFIIITAAGQGVELAQRLISDFETRLPLLHGAKDHATGYYVSTNRKGEQETFSLLSLSIAIISVARRAVESYAQLASMATEVKNQPRRSRAPRWWCGRGMEMGMPTQLPQCSIRTGISIWQHRQ